MTLTPPLKWAGGKRWQLPHLRPLWEPHYSRRLVEPFCGGLAVAIGLNPERALLNDINPHLVNFYEWLKVGLVIDRPMTTDEALYYEYRARFNNLILTPNVESAEAAGLFYYLNRTGFNGLCRFNKKGQFNVPCGRYTSVSYTRDFTDYQHLFRNWSFSVGDFEALTLRPDDFVYADPPYDSTFTAYSAGGFSWDDQIRVATWLSTHPGPVILVNQATDRIRTLYTDLGYTMSFLDAPRRISCNGDRTPAKEVFATRNL